MQRVLALCHYATSPTVICHWTAIQFLQQPFWPVDFEQFSWGAGTALSSFCKLLQIEIPIICTHLSLSLLFQNLFELVRLFLRFLVINVSCKHSRTLGTKSKFEAALVCHQRQLTFAGQKNTVEEKHKCKNVVRLKWSFQMQTLCVLLRHQNYNSDLELFSNLWFAEIWMEMKLRVQ